MGRRDRITSDPALARDHEAGATIELLQPLVHELLGAMGYVWPRHWVAHLGRADKAFDHFVQLHRRLVEIPVNASNARHLPVDDYLFDVYGTGTELVVSVALTGQHLADEIERTAEATPYGGPLVERIKRAAVVAGMRRPVEYDGFDGFIEIVKVRDALEHPKPGNTYNGAPGEWDKVPLAWMLSDRAERAYRRFSTFIDRFAGDWDEARSDFARPATLTGVRRGVRSKLSPKKPPKSSD